MTREDMYELIREGDLPEIRAAVTAWFAACAGQYRRVILMEQEYIRALRSSPFQPDPGILKAGLGLELKLEEYEHWVRLREDRKLWEAGRFPDSEAGAPWLYLAAADRAEADPEDRIRFFQLMDAFSVPTALFEISPPDFPRWRAGISPHHLYGRRRSPRFTEPHRPGIPSEGRGRRVGDGAGPLHGV